MDFLREFVWTCVFFPQLVDHHFPSFPKCLMAIKRAIERLPLFIHRACVARLPQVDLWWRRLWRCTWDWFLQGFLWSSRNVNLVAGLEDLLFSIIYGIILPIDFHILQDGYCTSNQVKICVMIIFQWFFRQAVQSWIMMIMNPYWHTVNGHFRNRCIGGTYHI